MNKLFEKSNFKYFAFLAVFLIASQSIGEFFGKSRADKEIENQRNALISEIDSYSKKLPKKIDGATTQISINYEKSTKTLVYKNILTDYANSQISNKISTTFYAEFINGVKLDACKNLINKYQYVLHNVESKYFSSSNKPIFEINTTIIDCKNFSPK